MFNLGIVVSNYLLLSVSRRQTTQHLINLGPRPYLALRILKRAKKKSGLRASLSATSKYSSFRVIAWKVKHSWTSLLWRGTKLLFAPWPLWIKALFLSLLTCSNTFTAMLDLPVNHSNSTCLSSSSFQLKELLGLGSGPEEHHLLVKTAETQLPIKKAKKVVFNAIQNVPFL